MKAPVVIYADLEALIQNIPEDRRENRAAEKKRTNMKVVGLLTQTSNATVKVNLLRNTGRKIQWKNFWKGS